MKTLQLNKQKNLFAMFALMLMFALTITTVIPASVTPAYALQVNPQTADGKQAITADEDADASGGGYNLDTLEGNATDAIGEVQEFLVNISLGLFPVALIVGLITLFFTHDERKISVVTKICFTIVIVTALIIFINGGHALNIVTEFVENAFN